MTGTSVVFFSMGQEGHDRRLRLLASELAEREVTSYMFTHERFAAQVAAAGGIFVDLFADRPLEPRSDRFIPNTCRYVTFAATNAESVIQQVASLRPSLIVYDTFALIGQVVAMALAIPYVNVCAGHNVTPARVPSLVRTYPSVEISPDCHRAVEVLRVRYGLEDASPFSYATALSPFLNVYCEPPRFLNEGERQAFDPVAFFGSLPSVDDLRARPGGPSVFGDDGDALRIYVSFGTVIWHYFAAEALQALRTISATLAGRKGVRVLISLGGADVGTAAADLVQENVAVERYVDQWAVLGDTDAFVTHHGMNSTHEAIFNRVPMLSYPFLWDQPALAAKCQELGLGVPLVDDLRAPVTERDVGRALDAVGVRKAELCSRLEEARRWELEVIGQRDSVVDRITNFA
ncbi:MAG: glycosyl transferase family 1 [Acidimicrobiales bacterium]|nr:glycosyl transferase family 1 [Acidimicrobiales bacterium]